jgi:peptidoglycan-associated lipoprotein
MRKNLLVSTLLASLFLSACSSTPTDDELGAGAGAGGYDASTQNIPTVMPTNTQGLAALRDPSNPLSRRDIYFDFDSFSIRSEYQPLVETHARFLMQNPQMRILVQGNTDERGSREYNLALGQKRADAVRRAMGLLGVQDAQIESVSLGEEKPRCTDRTEDCFAQNRRAEILYSGEF